jgi:hypothetical protein
VDEMKFGAVRDLLAGVDGCTFASIDAVTMPCKGVRRVVTGESVILFTNKGGSGYENMVKRRLEKSGKDPESFTVGDLPWGVRLKGTPFIAHKGKAYLQTILLSPGTVKYYMGTRELSPEAALGLIGNKEQGANQGLKPSNRVIVNTYMVENITAIHAMGKELVADESEVDDSFQVPTPDPEAMPNNGISVALNRANAAKSKVSAKPAPKKKAAVTTVLDSAPAKEDSAPTDTDALKMAAQKATQPDDDDGGLPVWATAEFISGVWRMTNDIVGPMPEVMEMNGFRIVKLSELNGVARPLRETLSLKTA